MTNTGQPEIPLTVEEQVSSLAFAIERLDDIADDVQTIEGWQNGGVLLGIKAVAENTIPGLKNISDNIRVTAAELSRLRERVRVLEGALEPFAKFARHVRAEHPGWDTDKYQIDPTLQSNCEFPGMGAFRRARSALSQKDGE